MARLIVDTNLDESNGIDVGGTSLREAIAAAVSGDTIAFSNSFPDAPIVLVEGELAIATSLTIDTEGRNLVIEGDSRSRVLAIDDGNDETAIAVVLIGLTISGGSVSDSGGGILNRESLSLSEAIVSGNSAGENGGGIYNAAGTVSLANSTVSGNSADFDGGGIVSVAGTLSLADSTLSDNSAGFDGGGIRNASGTVAIADSTLSGNSAGFDGGGLRNASGTVAIANSTLSGNTSADDGGGIDNFSGTVSLSNSTVSDNSAADRGGGAFNRLGTIAATNSTVSHNSASVRGGGIYNSGDAARVELESAIVADNTADSPDRDLFDDGGTIAARFSLVEDGSVSEDGGNNIFGSDPLLGVLRDNGGPTATRSLSARSEAIDAGSNPEALPFDARGEGFEREFNGRADMGAFERQSLEDDGPVLDADGNGEVTAFEDGLIVFRFLAGLSASTFAGAIATDATRNPNEIEAHLSAALQEDLLDIDGDRSATAFEDGLIIFRFLGGLDSSTFASAFADDASRDADAVEAWLESLI